MIKKNIMCQLPIYVPNESHSDGIKTIIINKNFILKIKELFCLIIGHDEEKVLL